MRAREQQFHNAWRASAVSQESAGTTTPSTREKKKELNDVVGLGQSQIASSERYAKISSQKVKQEYLRTMQKILKQGPV